MANALSRLFFDPVDRDRERIARRYQFADDSRSWLVPTALGGALLVVALVLGLTGQMQRFLFAYLIGWTFCLSIAIGSLFFVMIQHITKAKWSTTLRRIPELMIVNFPLLALAGVPILLGMHDLFHWSHADLYEPGSHYDEILVGKAGYFFVPFVPESAGGFPLFFVARYVLYFAVLSLLGSKLYRLSVRNDTEPSAQNTLDLRFHSAWGIPVAAVVTAFASYDYLMSLEPHWFSTIFGVYFFAGGWLASLSLITFMALWFKNRGMLREEISTEHLHDMGKFMFGFVVFWAYIAFSQYMLYWYGNLPEETVWFFRRLEGGWSAVAASLLVMHFILPFLILIPRFAKRTAPILAVMAVWLLVMHWVDFWWVAMPAMIPAEGAHGAGHALQMLGEPSALLASLQPEGIREAAVHAAELDLHVVQPGLPLLDLAAWLGLFGLFIGVTLLRATRHALTPYNDPYFEESLRFENV